MKPAIYILLIVAVTLIASVAGCKSHNTATTAPNTYVFNDSLIVPADSTPDQLKRVYPNDPHGRFNTVSPGHREYMKVADSTLINAQ